MNSSAVDLARTLRSVLLDAHDATAEAARSVEACGHPFSNDAQAQQLWRLLADRVHSDVEICMALAHLADAVVEALELREFHAG